MHRYKFTWVGIILAVSISIVSNIIDIDPFDKMVKIFNSMEQYEIDELFFSAIVFLIFLSIDLIIHQRSSKIEKEKIKVYKAMIASSHHILNNFLNQMQLFKITAQKTPNFDKKILSLYDVIIKEATDQIDALSSIEKVDEESIHKSVHIASKFLDG